MSDEIRTAAIVTFSQTGNTRQVAEAVGQGLRAGGVSVEQVDLLKADPAEAARADILGVGTPVFYYREPEPVARFLAALPRAKRGAAFTFITHGGNPVNTLRRMQKALRRRGRVVVNSYACTGYDTYPMYFRVFREWGHPDEGELAEARDFGERLVREARWLRDERRFAEPKYRFVGGKYFMLSLLCRGGMMKRLFPALRVDESVCTKCGVCARNCPAGAITLSPYPTVDEKCIWCYQCERICPEQAFDTDWSDLRKKMNA